MSIDIARLFGKMLDDPLAILTAAIALFNFLLIWVVLCQLRDTRKSSKQQLRAYVFGNGGSITLVASSPGEHMQIHASNNFKNSGLTPAYKASIWTKLEIFDADAPLFNQHTGLGNFAIGPGANFVSEAGCPLTHPELDDIRAEKKAVPLKDGPLQINGNVELCTGTGRTITRVQVTYLCRCGSSANKPFCDGSHAKIGFVAEGD